MLSSLPKLKINCLWGWINLDLHKAPIRSPLLSDTQLYDNTFIRQDLINKYLLEKAKLELNDTFLLHKKVNSLYVTNHFLCVDMLFPKYFVKLKYDFLW
jgi:hypothetical protein